MTGWDTFPLSIPGLDENIAISVPKKRLPVCIRCKHQYKTRKLCREKKKHTGLPWRKMYICITMDDSCFTKEGNCKKGPFIASNSDWQPFQYKDDVSINSDFPMCASCKSKNYTASYCRERRNAHRDLPWDTVFVTLSAKNVNLEVEKNDNDVALSDNNKETSTKKNSEDRGIGTVQDYNGNQSISNDSNKSQQGSEKDEDILDLKGIKRKSTDDDMSTKKTKSSNDGGSNDEVNQNNEDLVNKKENKDIFAQIDKSRTFCVEVSHYGYHAQVCILCFWKF